MPSSGAEHAQKCETPCYVHPGDLVANRFEIERLAGTGGMGTVYRARDHHSGHVVALKVLKAQDDPSLERFTREARALAELAHPAIVRFIAYGHTQENAPYLALEWLEGESLSERLRRGALTIAESLTIGVRVAEGLGTAHRRGIIHRDVKPSNIWLVNGRIEEARIIDFGIARFHGEHTLTQTGALIGTPGYISPEQARDGKEVDARADVFSLACVLFRCLTGKRAFDGEDVMATLLKLVLEEPPRLRELCPAAPEALEELMERMLSKSPAARPIDGVAVAEQLSTIEAQIEVHGGDAAPPSSRAPASLTIDERAVMCVVLARTGGSKSASDESATEVTIAMPDAKQRSLGAELETQGAELAILADRSLVVTVPGTRAFTDQAARAARAGLTILARYPAASVAVVAGRGERSARLPMGEVVSRGIALLRRAKPGELRIDKVLAGLLSSSFVIDNDPAGAKLLGESKKDEIRRTLLGREAPFVGREREMSMLEAIFDEVATEHVARVVIVTAPAGFGKSRLRFELIRALRERFAFGLWFGRGDAMRAGSPFGLLAPAIRALVGIKDGEPVAARRRALSARVSERVPAKDRTRVTVFLGELVGVAFEDEASVELSAARQDPMLMGDQIRRAFEDFVAAECSAETQLIVLEDLQWGDLPSLQLIDAVLRSTHDRPLMVLALGRPELGSLFPGLFAERATTQVRLAPLGRKASGRLVHALLGEELEPKALDRIITHAAGDAFFLEELIRAVAEGRGSALPETVLAMVEERLAMLDPEARRVLRAASIFGNDFSRGGVATLLGESPGAPRIANRLAELARRELIQTKLSSRSSVEDEYVFRQSLVREAAYAMLTDEDRRLGHRLAGEWLERAGESEPGLLAEHFERGGAFARALAAYRRAATQALEGKDSSSALSWAERASRCASELPRGGIVDEELGAVRLIAAEARRGRDELALAEPLAREATELLPRHSRLWFVAVSELSLLSGRLGRGERLLALGRELLELWTPNASSAQIVAMAATAVPLIHRGEYALADGLLAKLIELGPSVADPRARARIYHALATRALINGDSGLHLMRMLTAARYYNEAGDLRSACMARITLGFSYADLGEFEQAEYALTEALATAEQMGLPGLSAYAKHILGLVLYRRGALEDALVVEREAEARFGADGDSRLAGGSRAYLALILSQLERFDEAESEATSAIESLDSAPPVLVYALAARARIRLARGNARDAHTDAGRARALLCELGGIEEGEALVRLTCAETLEANDRHDEARFAIEEAQKRLLARAARITDSGLQKSFLERVPENARTLELARAWLSPNPR